MNKIIKKEEGILDFRETKIGFFAGSFDPVHEGHLRVVEICLEKYVSYVIICPHSHNPDKNPITIVHRIEIIQRLCKNSKVDEKIFVCTPDVLHGLQNSRFISLLNNLMKFNNQVFVIIGIDALKDSYFEPLRSIPHIVFRRKGYNNKRLEILTGIVYQEDHVSHLSSAKVKHRLKNGHRCYSSSNVNEYIFSNSFYHLK